MLQGLIFDRHGRKMGPVHTRRNGQRFRYYATNKKHVSNGEPPAYRVAADAFEKHCLAAVVEHLAGQVRSIEDARPISTEGDPDAQREFASEHVCRVVVGDGELTIELKDGVVLQRRLARVRHGNDAKLMVGSMAQEVEPSRNQQLVVLLQDAARAQELALAKPKLGLTELASRFERSPERFKRLIRLSYLSPKIVAAILQGHQPERLTSRTLQHLDGLPLSWSEQEALLLG